MKQYVRDLDISEVISRLKQGERLVNETGSYFEMIDGFICCKWGDNHFINVSISQKDNYYFERPDPEIKIEIGKFYLTRDNKKAYVFNINSEGKYCVVTDNKMPYVVQQGGYYSDEGESYLDLVAPYGRQGVGSRTNKERYESIKKSLQQGLRKCEIAMTLGLSYPQVDNYIRQHADLQEQYMENRKNFTRKKKC